MSSSDATDRPAQADESEKALPVYDEAVARAADDWADVPGAPDQLHDVPTRCAFCQKFVAITDTDPVLLIGRLWRTPNRSHLYAAHERCLVDHGEGFVGAPPARDP